MIKSTKPKLKLKQSLKITKINKLLDSFGNNKNTAVKFEILTALYLLDTKYDYIDRIENLTQDDGSGTGDIKVIYKDGTEERISIKNYSGIKICSWNPSGKHFRVYKEDFMDLLDECYRESIEWRKDNNNLILDEGGFIVYFKKRLRGDPACKRMCEKLASVACDSFNKMDKSSQFEILTKMLDLKLDNSEVYSLNFDSIFDKKHYHKNIKLKKDFNIYGELKCIAKGINIKFLHKNPDDKFNEIASIQCKYNNGIIENRHIGCKPKAGDPFNSWNCKLNIDKVFDYESIEHNLDEWKAAHPDIMNKVNNKIKKK